MFHVSEFLCASHVSKFLSLKLFEVVYMFDNLTILDLKILEEFANDVLFIIAMFFINLQFLIDNG